MSFFEFEVYNIGGENDFVSINIFHVSWHKVFNDHKAQIKMDSGETLTVTLESYDAFCEVFTNLNKKAA